MKLKKFLKNSLAMALVFGSVGVLAGCNKDDNDTAKNNEKQYEIYKLATEAGYEGTYEEWLLSIKGEKGDKGAKGEKGDQGVQGENGKDGATWLSGTTTPIASLGKDGDFYYNSTSREIYRKDNGSWNLITIIQNGMQGEQGIQGVKGDAGREVEFRISSTHIQWRYKTDSNDEAWVDLVPLSELKGPSGEKGETGEKGERGSLWHSGEGTPSSEIEAKNGDYYIDISSSNIYKKNNDTWKFVCNIKGETGIQGEKGERGITWHSGEGSPSSNIDANVGDFYLDEISSVVYIKKEDGSWEGISTIKGETGEKGEKGDQGEDAKQVEFKVVDGYIKWRYVTDDDSDEWKSLVALDDLKGQNGEQGNRGESGLSITNIELSVDKWGISTKYIFTLSEGDPYVYSTTNVLDGVFYACEKEEDFDTLLSLGVTNIRLINDIKVKAKGKTPKRLATLEKENMVIDLNGYSIVSEDNTSLNDILSVQSNYEYDSNITIKNGTIGSPNSLNDYGITVFGGNWRRQNVVMGKLTLNIENVTSYGVYSGFSGNADYDGAIINVKNSKFIATHYNEDITDENITSDPDLGVGAYLPADNINNFENTEFVGPTGVYIKGGINNFTNCVIIGNGQKLNFVHSSNGMYSTGSALVAETAPEYTLPVIVNINGGRFESKNNLLIQELTSLTSNIEMPVINGASSAIIADGEYDVSTEIGILHISINKNVISVIDNENIKIVSYKMLNNGTIDVEISQKNEDSGEWENHRENYVLFANNNALINEDLLKDVYGTYSKFYLNNNSITWDSLKLYEDGTYKLYLTSESLEEHNYSGTYTVCSVTDNEYIIKIDDKTISINAYTNSFEIN